MTTTLDDFEARLVTLLDEVRAVTTGGRAAVEPDGTPSHVAPGELVESAWGNAVVDTLNSYGPRLSLNNADIIIGGYLVQTRIQVLTTNASGEITCTYRYPFAAQPGIVVTNAEPALPHSPMLKTPSTTNSVFTVRSLVDGSLIVSAATAVTYIAIGNF